MARNIDPIFSLSDILEKRADKTIERVNSARVVHDIFVQDQEHQQALKKIAEAGQKYRDLQSAGAQASIESRDQLVEQNKVLKQQLAEQTEINQRLDNEFKKGAREAVITRRIAYWSLGVGIVGVIIAIISLFRG